MSFRLAGKIVTVTARVICAICWLLLGLWTALAVFFHVPLPFWPAAIPALGIVALYVVALREPSLLRSWKGLTWRQERLTAAALALTAAVLVWYVGFVVPNPNEDWIPKHSRMPHVEVKGDKVYVNNVRDYCWHSPTDFIPGYQDRVYDLNKINSMYFVLSPIFDLEPIAHVWVGFGFTDGQHVAISVESRGVKDRPYGLLESMFRQFQLIYVIGEERDVVGLRGAVWKNEVRFYPVRATPDRMRAIFVDIMNRAHDLEEHPEFYNLFANNCMNNVTAHVRRLGGRPMPSDLRLLMTGFSDRLAYDYGFLDTDLPFEQAHQAFRVDEWIRQIPLDDTFSGRLREFLKRQGADHVPP